MPGGFMALEVTAGCSTILELSRPMCEGFNPQSCRHHDAHILLHCNLCRPCTSSYCSFRASASVCHSTSFSVIVCVCVAPLTSVRRPLAKIKQLLLLNFLRGSNNKARVCMVMLQCTLIALAYLALLLLQGTDCGDFDQTDRAFTKRSNYRLGSRYSGWKQCDTAYGNRAPDRSHHMP